MFLSLSQGPGIWTLLKHKPGSNHFLKDLPSSLFPWASSLCSIPPTEKHSVSTRVPTMCQYAPDSLESWEGPRAMSTSLTWQSLSRRPQSTCCLRNVGKGQHTLGDRRMWGTRSHGFTGEPRTHKTEQPASSSKSPTHHPQRHCPLGTMSTHQRAIEQTREDALEVLDPKYMVEKRLLPPRWMDVGEQPGCFYP